MPIASFQYPVDHAAIYLRPVMSIKLNSTDLCLTLDMLDTKFFDKSRREHTRRKRTTKYGAELRVQTSDTHILKFEVRSDNGIRRRSEKDINIFTTIES